MANQPCTHIKEYTENVGVLIVEHIFSGDKSKTEVVQAILEHCGFREREIEN